MKQFHFSVGLPRSGSILLTTLLNQNHFIHASHGSYIPVIFSNLDKLFPTLPEVVGKQSLDKYDAILTNLYPNFFNSVKENIIVDKLNRRTNLEETLTCLGIANPNYKVIVPIRPILEVLASFLFLCNKYPEINMFDQDIKARDYSSLTYKNMDDIRCDYLMSEEGPILKSIAWLAYAKQNPNNFMFVKYDDLTNHTQKTMNKVYDFIGAPLCENDLTKIQTTDMKQADFEIYGIPTLHEVKTTISKSTTDINILSNYTKNKYGETLDFLNLFA